MRHSILEEFDEDFVETLALERQQFSTSDIYV